MRHEREIVEDHVDPLIRRLIEVRLAWKLSLNDVANRCGADLNTFKRYENGTNYPSGKMLARWADVLGYELSIWPKGELGGSGYAYRGLSR